jgi:hypothetical protein
MGASRPFAWRIALSRTKDWLIGLGVGGLCLHHSPLSSIAIRTMAVTLALMLIKTFLLKREDLFADPALSIFILHGNALLSV